MIDNIETEEETTTATEDEPTFIRPPGDLLADYVLVLAEKIGKRFDVVEAKLNQILEIVSTPPASVATEDEDGMIN